MAQDSKDFLIDTSNGGWAYHQALGWVRSTQQIILSVYNDTSVFLFNDNDPAKLFFVKQDLTLEDIQNLHLFNGTFFGNIAIDVNNGHQGSLSAFECVQATEILNPDGFTAPFRFGGDNRRVNVSYSHNDDYVILNALEGTSEVRLSGTNHVDVEDEDGNIVSNLVPRVEPGEFFTYTLKVTKGLAQTMFLYINDVLVANPLFAEHGLGSASGNRVIYTSASTAGTDRVSYMKYFGSIVNTSAPRLLTPWILNNADITGAFPVLADYSEKADEGGTDYVQSEKLKDLPTTTMEGAFICICSGKDKGHDAVITDYDPATGKITYVPISSGVNDSSVVFDIVIRSYEATIDRAYVIIKNDMRNTGFDITKFLDFEQMKELHLNKTLELICMSKRQDTDSEDLYHEAYLLYSKQYIQELDNIKADYDVNEDGIISEDEKSLSEGIILVQ